MPLWEKFIIGPQTQTILTSWEWDSQSYFSYKRDLGEKHVMNWALFTFWMDPGVFLSHFYEHSKRAFLSNIFANFSGNKEGNTILVKQILSLRAQFDVSRFFIYLLSYFSIKLRRTTELWRRYALFPQKCHSSVTIRYVTHWRMNKKKKNTVRKQTSNIIIFTAITVIYARCFRGVLSLWVTRVETEVSL